MMTLDTVLAIAGLAIAVGGLVPVFLREGRVRQITLGITISALILLSAIGAYRAILHKREVEYLSDEVLRLLAKRPSTIYQLEQGTHHASFPILLEAVDRLVRARQIQYDVPELYDVQRNEYFVGIYSVQTIR